MLYFRPAKLKLVKVTENFIIYFSMVGWKIKLVATIATEASKAGKKAIVHLVSFITHYTATLRPG